MENGVELSFILHEVDIESHALKRDPNFFGINLTICILVRKLRGNSPPKKIIIIIKGENLWKLKLARGLG